MTLIRSRKVRASALAAAVLAAAAAAAAAAPIATAQAFLPPPDLVDQVLSGDPVVLAGEARIGMSRGEQRRLKSGDHEWTLSGTYLRREIDGAPISFGEYDATLSRRLRLPGKGRLDREIGDATVRSAEQYAEDARHQAALVLMDHWMNWLAAAEAAEIARDLATAYEQELRVVERRAELQDAAEIEVELARAANADALAQKTQAEGAQQQARTALATVFPELPLPAWTPTIDAPVELRDADQWEGRMIERSHEIGYYQAESDRLSAIARRSRSDRLPDPEFGLMAFSERGGEETGLGVVFSVPLGGGARSGAAMRDESAASIARQQLERTRREIRSIARTDVIAAQTGYAAWLEAANALAASTSAIQRMRRGFELDAVSLTELQIAERRHAEVRRSEAEARGEANRAWLKLMIDSHEMWLD